MMDASEPCVPPGFRFHPTDEELVGYYLRKKIASQKVDLVIKDIDLYRIEPWDLQDKCRIGYEEQNEWYFFSHKDKKYPTGTRTNRATMAGFWEATGRDKAVYEKHRLIGMRKTLVFYKGRAPNGQKSDWIMHEYRLESDENAPPREEGWVVCKAFKKRNTNHTKSIERWESTYNCYDEQSGVSSVLDPIDYVTRQNQRSFPPQNFITKQVIDDHTLNILHADPFIQLPQLESPSLPLMKSPSSSISLVSKNIQEENDQQIINACDSGSKKVTTDWRDLDKFVASQLSHDQERQEGNSISSFQDQDNTDLGLLLLQSSKEEAAKLNGFLGSSSDYELGICIFDK